MGSALVAMAIAMAGCGGSAEPGDAGSVVDAASGVDGGVGDGGRDAGADAGGGGVDAGSDAGLVADAGTDAGGGGTDAGSDAGVDAAATDDAGNDAASPPDTGVMRTALLPGFCPSTATPAGLYRGTLASNTNDLSGATGCGSSSAPGRDGAVRVELDPGQTVTARYRHAGDGVLYLLDSCPVISSCLAASDASSSGEESITWTNTGTTRNPVYVALDSASLGGPQTFELDLEITGP